MANVLLLVAKIIVTLTSSSLSVLASLVDSALDFISTLIIYAVSRMIQHKDWKTRYKFPVGKARLEPIGVLVFSVIMIVSFIQVMVQAFQRLREEEETHDIVVLSLQSILIMASTGTLLHVLVDCSCGKIRMLVMVTIGQEFRSPGISSGRYERRCLQVLSFS